LPNLKKRPRLQFVDTGLLNQVLMVQAGMIGIPDLNQVYRGRIIQHLLYQEITSIHPEPDYKPRFWVRKERNSQAEVDLVYPFSQHLIPLEVKSGKQGKLRSLHQFVEKSRHPFAVRFYRGPYSVEKVRTPGGHPYVLMNLPYFLGTRLELYLHHLIQEYPV
jgi:predicted AAA+ superfamily ATPase